MDRGTLRSWIGEVACGAALAATGIAFAIASRRMPLIEDNTPGPGMAPFFLGLLLAGLGAMIAGQAIVRRSVDLVRILDRETLIGLCLMLAVVLTFDWLGFALSTFLFLWLGFVLIGREPGLPAALFAGTATMLTWALFVKALGVVLPRGLVALP